MNGSRRWKEFISWWRNLDTFPIERVDDLEKLINLKIDEIQKDTHAKQ